MPSFLYFLGYKLKHKILPFVCAARSTNQLVSQAWEFLKLPVCGFHNPAFIFGLPTAKETWPYLWRQPRTWVLLQNQVWIGGSGAQHVVVIGEEWAVASWGQDQKPEEPK